MAIKKSKKVDYVLNDIRYFLNKYYMVKNNMDAYNLGVNKLFYRSLKIPKDFRAKVSVIYGDNSDAMYMLDACYKLIEKYGKSDNLDIEDMWTNCSQDLKLRRIIAGW